MRSGIGLRSHRFVTALVGGLLALSCGSDDGGNSNGSTVDGSGGLGFPGLGSGGAPPSYGGAGSGGAPGTPQGGSGGAVPGGSGGAGGWTDPGAGGWTDPGAGGAPETGGAIGAGGAPETGGAPGVGGASNGGASSGGASGFDEMLLGVYTGNSPSGITQFEQWLGRPVDGILGYTGNASWEDYDGSVGWAVGVWNALDRRVLWSVPLIPNGASLAEAAAGNYDEHYKKAARTLSTYRPQEPVLYIRTGWEFNGDWFPWNAHGGKAQAFAGAFRKFVDAFRSVSPRFKFEWNVNVGDVGMNPEDAYPGDAHVDIIGMDFYWNTQWDPKDAAGAWNSMRTRKWGLDWHQDFAAAHGKPTSYSEWGIMSNDGAYYVEQAKAWFVAHHVVYQTYWNSNNAFTGMLSSGQYPNAGAAYKAQFGTR